MRRCRGLFARTQKPIMEGSPVQQSVQRPQRPMPVTILALIAFVVGAVDLVGSFVYIGMTGANSIFAILNLVLALAYIGFGLGTWGRQRWAWSLGVSTAAAWIIVQAVYLFVYPGYNIINLVAVTIVPAIILYYLTTPDFKRAFGQA